MWVQILAPQLLYVLDVTQSVEQCLGDRPQFPSSVKSGMIVSIPISIVAKCEVRSYAREGGDAVWYYLEFS